MNFFDEITDAERVKQYKEPDEWDKQRVGRFTGSEIHTTTISFPLGPTG